jgi:WD40 repeat protein
VSLPGMALSVVPCSGYLKQMLGSAWLLPPAECTTPPPANLDATVALVHPTQFEQFEDAAPVALAVSGNGEYVAYGGADRVEVIQLATRSVTDLPVAGGVTGVSFGPRNELLVMSDKAVYLWQPTSGRQALAIAQPSPPIDAELSENGARLATANAGGTVQVWDAGDGRALATLRPPSGPPLAYFPMGPVRVALNGDGTVVASGDTYGQVCFWDVSTRRLVAKQLLAANWPIVELQPAAGGSRLLAVDFPQAGSGVNAPAAAAVFDASTGREVSAYSSPGPRLAPIDPGAALSPDGSFLLAGALGLTPTPPGGTEDVYQLSSGEVMAGLDGVTSAAPVSYSSLPAQPWSPNGTQVLIGNAIYECGACGSLTQLQAEAASRSDWSRPLSAQDDRPPATNPYA